MKTEYFKDTDTLLLEFSDNNVEKTRDLNENILGEFDSAGNFVRITIEHIKEMIS